MGNQFINFLLFFFFSIPAWSQVSHTFDLKLDFQFGKYKLENATFYDAQSSVAGSKKDGSSLIPSSFQCQNYQTYTSFFLSGECHVTLETFTSWKEQFGQYAPILLSHYILSDGKIKYSITKYILRYNNTNYIVSSAQKEINGQWYFLNIEENLSFQPFLLFFSSAQENFFLEIRDKNSIFYQNKDVFEGEVLRAEFLTSNFMHKYRNESPYFQILNVVFENLVQPLDRNTTARYPEFANYLKKAQLRKTEYEFIINLLNASLPTNAVTHFLEQTGMTFEQLIEDCPNALTP